MRKFKTLSPSLEEKIVREIKLMIFASRDCLWNRWDGVSGFDPSRIDFLVSDGYFGSSNLDAVQEGKSPHARHNLKRWFNGLVEECMEEDGMRNGTSSPEKTLENLRKYRDLTAL